MRFIQQNNILKKLTMNKEELIEKIKKELGDVFTDIGLNMIYQVSEQYATSQTETLKKEIEELRKEREWISVEDELPKEFASVLVVGDDIRSCALYKDKKFYSDFPLPKNEEVTHWMPLPTPPKTK